MGFLFKAGFWFGIVLLFLPVGTESMRGTRQLAEHSAQSLVDTAHHAAKFCIDQPEVCKATAKSTQLAGDYVALAADKIAERETAKQAEAKPAATKSAEAEQ